VLADPDTLDTLPAREVRAGYAEVVKYGLIDDAGFFDWCEAHGAALIAGEAQARVTAIARSLPSLMYGFNTGTSPNMTSARPAMRTWLPIVMRLFSSPAASARMRCAACCAHPTPLASA
jgi:hypothetical protein